MKTIEKTFIIFLSAGISLKFLNLPFGSTIIYFLSLFLAIFYFLFSFALLNNISFKNVFKKNSYIEVSGIQGIISVHTGIAFSTFFIGFVYRVLHYEFGTVLIWNGFTFLMIFLLLSLYKFFKSHSLFYKGILIRSLIFLSFFLLHFLIK